VRSTIVEPGAVDTELTDHLRDGVREKVRERLAGATPLEASDVADAIAYAVTRPWHVCLNEILIRPTEQVG
jgi:NADP-dependent 3-hydroxy acid dehydrogenase YdfG